MRVWETGASAVRRVPVLLIVLLVVLPGSARAATVSLGEPTNEYFSGPSLNFVAAGGERNEVTIGVGADRSVTIRDVAAPLVAGTGCQALDGHRARCSSGDPASEIESGYADLKDGDDRVAAIVPRAAGWGALGLRGGAGADMLDASAAENVVDPKGGFGSVVLGGGAGADRLIGGQGDDTFVGGAGDDTLAGGAGADTLDGDDSNRRPRGNDSIGGGSGDDTVSYEGRRTRVRVDLARPARARARKERDSLVSIENVIGGEAHDVLLGGAGNNRLQGSGTLFQHRGAGDTLVGRGGNDELLDFGGRSRLSGGAGADELAGTDAHDRLRCGRGRDTVSESGGALVPRSCERFTTQDHAYGPFVVRRNAAIVRTRPLGRGGECKVILTLRSRARVVYGRARFRRARRVVISLTRAGRRAAASHRVVLVDAFERCADTHDVWRVRL